MASSVEDPNAKMRYEDLDHVSCLDDVKEIAYNSKAIMSLGSHHHQLPLP